MAKYNLLFSEDPADIELENVTLEEVVDYLADNDYENDMEDVTFDENIVTYLSEANNFKLVRHD